MSLRGIEYLYFNESNYQKILKMLSAPYGIILVKNFKKMLYDKSITEEEFNNNLNSLYEPMFQQIKLRAKFAGFSINL